MDHRYPCRQEIAQGRILVRFSISGRVARVIAGRASKGFGRRVSGSCDGGSGRDRPPRAYSHRRAVRAPGSSARGARERGPGSPPLRQRGKSTGLSFRGDETTVPSASVRRAISSASLTASTLFAEHPGLRFPDTGRLRFSGHRSIVLRSSRSEARRQKAPHKPREGTCNQPATGCRICFRPRNSIAECASHAGPDRVIHG